MDSQPAERRGEIWAFWLGVASLTCLGPLTGLLAVGLGAVVLARAPRGERSPPLAIAGILAGGFGTAAGVLVAVIGAWYWQARIDHQAVVTSPPAELIEGPVARGPSLPPGHPPIDGKDRDEPKTASEHIGGLTLVQVGTGEPRSLPSLLRSVRIEQAALVVYVRAERCAPCKRFEASLSSAPMQKALGRSVLVALDAAAFELDLRALRIDSHDVPTFVRIGAPDVTAVDAMTGIEWDDDTPENMAPVFTRFLAGALHERREAPPFVGTSL